MSLDLYRARSLLFVPATRPERFLKAQAAGADLFCIDLEDATATTLKAQARQQTVEFLAAQQSQSCLVRINSLRSASGLEDLLALKASGLALGVAVAKVEAAAELEIARAILGSEICLLPVLESALGIERAFEIAASPGCTGLMLGAADYCAQLGAKIQRESLAYPRARLLAAAASQGLASVDVPYFEIADEAGLAEQTRHSQNQGFSCISAVHPRQLEVIHLALQPSTDEIRQAQALLHAAVRSTEAAFAFEGKMIDRPLVLAAQRILGRAGIAIDR